MRVTAAEMVPMIEVMKELVKEQTVVALPTLGFWRYYRVVTVVKGLCKAAKHARNAKVVLVMTVERGWVVDYCNYTATFDSASIKLTWLTIDGSGIPRPQVTV